MRIDIDVNIRSSDSQVSAKLDTILAMLRASKIREEQMAQSLEALTTQVQANTDTEASAVVLIQGLAAQIAAAGTDPVALQALQDKLKTSADSLAAAVVANTPAA